MNQKYKSDAPKWSRPKLSSAQLRDLDIAHLQTLDALKVGEPDAAANWLGSTLLFWKVAQQVRAGQELMDDQLALADQLLWRSPGPADWSLLTQGIDHMRDLGELVDKPLAAWCADWAQREAERRAAKADSAHVGLEQV